MDWTLPSGTATFRFLGCSTQPYAGGTRPARGRGVIKMEVRVQFFSWFRDHTGCESMTMEVPEGTTLEGLHEAVLRRQPELVPARRSTLRAVGLDYQEGGYVLKPGDEVSLFPPVQGG